MEYKYPDLALSILRDLLVLDRYQRAADRPVGDEFAAADGEVCLFETFLDRLLEGFLDSLSIMMRDGQQPFELHLATGIGQSRLQPPGLLAALFGTPPFIDVPAVTRQDRLPAIASLLFLPLPLEVAETTIDMVDLDLRPAAGQGDISLSWSVDDEAFVLRMVFETLGTELRGYVDVGGVDTPLSVDLTEVLISVLLKPRLAAKRLLWDLIVQVNVSVGQISAVPPIFALIQLQGGAPMIAEKVEDQFRKTIEDMLKDHVPVIGAALGTIPLRPVSDTPDSLVSAECGVSMSLFELEKPESLAVADRDQLFGLMVGDCMNQSLFEASMLGSNFRHVFPSGEEIVHHREQVLVDPERYLRSHMEWSHLANRTGACTSLRFEDIGIGRADLLVDHFPFPDVPDAAGIECMRYLVSLEAISFAAPGSDAEVRFDLWLEDLARMASR